MDSLVPLSKSQQDLLTFLRGLDADVDAIEISSRQYAYAGSRFGTTNVNISVRIRPQGLLSCEACGTLKNHGSMHVDFEWRGGLFRVAIIDSRSRATSLTGAKNRISNRVAKWNAKDSDA